MANETISAADIEARFRDGVIEILKVWKETGDINTTAKKADEVFVENSDILLHNEEGAVYPVFTVDNDLAVLTEAFQLDQLGQKKKLRKPRPSYPVPQEVINRQIERARKRLLETIDEMSRKYDI